MGIRLETILPLFIVVIVAGTYWIRLETGKLPLSQSGKELEFKEMRFIEVDTNRTLGIAYSEAGDYTNRIWTLHHLTYHTPAINYLQADKGTYRDNFIYMDGNIKMEQPNGYLYSAEHANYNKLSEELEITSPFTATLGENIFKGDWMLYKAPVKEGLAKEVNAVVYTRDKE